MYVLTYYDGTIQYVGYYNTEFPRIFNIRNELNLGKLGIIL